MNESPWMLEREVRLIVLRAILEVCKHREWRPYGVHVRSTHIHAVIGGNVEPERMLSNFKAYATRALRSAAAVPERRRYWADHGSTRYLWNETSLKAATDYVLRGQGVLMACYPNEPEEANDRRTPERR